MADMLRALCMGCDKNEPHYKFYRHDYTIYAYCGAESIGVLGRIMCPSTLQYGLHTGALERLHGLGSYRNPEEKRIKIPEDFFSLSTNKKINNLKEGKYDI